VILRSGQVVHTQVLSELRSQHRILAWLKGPLPELPPLLATEATIKHEGEFATIESAGDLQPLLGWLAELPLRDIRIEPVGLRAIYERYHRAEATTARETRGSAEVENSRAATEPAEVLR
jgi:ABC-2 type transport system ATP-binding protein